MSKFINKILKEAEDSSDDFFQSKHVNKRKEEFKSWLKAKKKEVIPKLIKGLEEIKITYRNKDWRDVNEKLFLELFSRLHVDKTFNQDKHRYEYYLLNEYNKRRCFYDLINNEFWIDYYSIWRIFEEYHDMDYVYIQLLIDRMLEEYFKLYDVTATCIVVV